MRSLVAGLQAMGEIEVRGQKYSGPELALLVTVNLENAIEESAKTPQLISELGRLAASALADKEILEAQYIMWREGATIARMDAVEKLSKTAAESWVHSQPEYLEWKRKIAIATEAWSAIFSAYEAAKARSYVFSGFPQASGARDGGNGYTDGARYHGGTLERQGKPLPVAEDEAVQAPRTPIPARKPGPPPPPPRRQ